MLGAIPIAPASADWSPVNSPDPGFHEIIIEDSVEFFRQYSFLNDFRNGKEFVCANMSSGSCKTLKGAYYNVILPVCESRTQLDCIVELAITGQGIKANGVFQEYTMPRHPSLFRGDGRRLPANPQSPSIWEMPDAPHASGTQYAVHVGFTGGINGGVVTSSDFYAQVYAIERLPGLGEQFDQNNFANFNWCNFDPKTRAVIGCGGGGGMDGQICVVDFQTGGDCGAKRAIPKDYTITLSLRLSKEPNGWYHGRLDNPELALAKSGKGVLMKITGEPIEVPILYHSGFYPELSAAVKRYWDRCLKDYRCPRSTRQFGAQIETMSGAARNVTSEQKAWTPKALETVRFFNKVNRGFTPKVEQVWAVRSLENTNARGGRCYSSKGFKGMITTNATAYTDGPPTLSRGVLRYGVAAPSKVAADGAEVLGNYNLVMRNSFAQCIYGSRVVSPRAEVSVTAIDGDYRVATSVTSRNANWIRLSANNFNY